MHSKELYPRFLRLCNSRSPFPLIRRNRSLNRFGMKYRVFSGDFRVNEKSCKVSLITIFSTRQLLHKKTEAPLQLYLSLRCPWCPTLLLGICNPITSHILFDDPPEDNLLLFNHKKPQSWYQQAYLWCCHLLCITAYFQLRFPCNLLHLVDYPEKASPLYLNGRMLITLSISFHNALFSEYSNNMDPHLWPNTSVSLQSLLVRDIVTDQEWDSAQASLSIGHGVVCSIQTFPDYTGLSRIFCSSSRHKVTWNGIKIQILPCYYLTRPQMSPILIPLHPAL